jgi:hypothetical protein
MLAEFHRLRGELATAMATLQPAIDAYEAKHAEISALEARELKPLAEKLRATREGLDVHGIQVQIAMLSRALGGVTGADPAAVAIDDAGDAPVPEAIADRSAKK